MKTEQANDGTWLAVGNGPLRFIIAEGGTRRESLHNWVEQWGQQDVEQNWGRIAALVAEEDRL